jgi:hypothetical protein
MRVADYKDLRVYGLAFESAMEIFKLSRRWPSEEKYSLADQIRRSSRSVCTNIAEAWRKRRYEAAFGSKLSDRLPKGVSQALGPDATGVGWAFMFSLNSTNHDLAELRSMQDWHLRYQLASVEGVSEVASVGGFVNQCQVTVDPTMLRAYNLSISDVAMAVHADVVSDKPGKCPKRELDLVPTRFRAAWQNRRGKLA